MKKLLLFALVATLAVVGCKKDEEERTYNAEVTVDGTKTTFDNLIFYSFGGSTSISSEGEDKEISIYISDPEVGTIEFGGSNGININIGDKTYTSNSGSFTITESNDSVISGSFTGTFYQAGSTNSITISGNFTAQYKNPFNISF